MLILKSVVRKASFYMSKCFLILVLMLAGLPQTKTDASIVHDVFFTTGQSNARWDTFAWGEGIRDTIVSSGRFENPIVVSRGHGGEPIRNWFDGGPQFRYEADFFNALGSNGALRNNLFAISYQGNTYRFRGLFWFQGESDGRLQEVPQYAGRWHGMLNELGNDLGSSDWNYVMNRVGNSGDEINDALQSITDNDPRGVLFDTQVAPYRTDPTDVHGYDHYLVGVANANLFINSFAVPEPSSGMLFLLGVWANAVVRRRTQK